MRNAAIKAWLNKSEDGVRSGHWEYSSPHLLWSTLEVARWESGEPVVKKVLAPFPKRVQVAIHKLCKALELQRSCVREEAFLPGKVSLWTVSSRGKALLGLPHNQYERRFSDEDDEAT